ncbi:MBL fold metallo-hydrolase [Bacillus nakamurai]|uniref:MBL fold metallo-hydrolase n=1 Tax=Bacillus nakamurai TaxID=1793963 RepID=UPI0009ED1D36|nr:MBL fold metallo-hydrolase [Bacillus nakamurai]
MEQLENLGYHPCDIKHIVLTHHHADHVGLLDRFPDNVKVYGHFKMDPWISQETTLYKQFDSFINTYRIIYGIPENFQNKLLNINDSLTLSCKRSLTNVVSEGDEIPSIPDFKIIETPGHSSTHICLYRERDGLLIGGDTLIQNVFLNTMLEPPALGETQRPKLLLQYNESIGKLKNLPIKRILPGHGQEIVDIHALIEQQFKKQKKRMKRVIKVLKEKPQTVFEVCTKLFVGFYEIQFLLALSETVGILDLLEQEKQIEMNCLREKWIYQISE